MSENVMNMRKMRARLDELVELGLGEWLIRVGNTWELVDYEAQIRKQIVLRRERMKYHRKRLRCIAGYRREGRNRGGGALIHTPSHNLSLGGAGMEPCALRIPTPGSVYRVTGQHRSDVTDVWLSVLDCDVDGSRISSPVVPPTEHVDFDGLSVLCNEVLLEEDDKEWEDDDIEDWVDGDMQEPGSVAVVVDDDSVLRVLRSDD